MDSWKHLLSGTTWSPSVRTFLQLMDLKEMTCLTTWSRTESTKNSLPLFTFHFSKTPSECTRYCACGKAAFSPQKKGRPSQFGLSFTESKKSWSWSKRQLRPKWSQWNVQSLKRDKKLLTRFTRHFPNLSTASKARTPSISSGTWKRSLGTALIPKKGRKPKSKETACFTATLSMNLKALLLHSKTEFPFLLFTPPTIQRTFQAQPCLKQAAKGKEFLKTRTKVSPWKITFLENHRPLLKSTESVQFTESWKVGELRTWW